MPYQVFVGLTKTPALAAILLKNGAKLQGLFFKFNNCLGSLAECYVGSAVLTNKPSGFTLAATLGAAVMLFKKVPGSSVPAEQQVFVCGDHLVRGASMERSEEMTKVVVIFSEPPSVQDYSALPGYNQLEGQFRSRTGTVFVSRLPQPRQVVVIPYV